MTAEVIVMNKRAVAMAADSAVTMSLPGSRKIFNTANKVFMLSNHEPVGVMFYGSDNFMGIPWETVLKVYRQRLSDTTFRSLEEYAEDFMSFLSQDQPELPISHEEDFVRSMFLSAFTFIKSRIRGDVEAALENGPLEENEIPKMAAASIKKLRDKWADAVPIQGLTEEALSELMSHYEEVIGGCQQRVFEKLPLTKRAVEDLHDICASLIGRQMYAGPAYSGIVVTGFGSEDAYPAFREYLTLGRFRGYLKFMEGRNGRLTFSNPACVVAFAQQEMVSMFMDGIDPQFQETVMSWLEKLFEDYAVRMTETVAETKRARSQLLRKLRTVNDELLEALVEKIEELQDLRYSRPILSAVEGLPKDELAAMAEALVNLTSFKRRVSTQDETVGGQIDVGVISKGDGYVWIKRKHYFRPELNPHFFTRFRASTSDGEELRDGQEG